MGKRTPKLKSLSSLSDSLSGTAWQRMGEQQALKNFHRAANEVPAYAKFLKKHGVNPRSVRTLKDFKKIPETNKKNYIERYSASERSPFGKLSAQTLLAASSGTTGAPTLWPRGKEQEAEAAEMHDFIFSEMYQVGKYRTLLIIGFPMGLYVSGIATTLPSFSVAEKLPNLTIATPGNNKEAILALVPAVQKEYEQIILAGHPFFVKDILESGKRQGISWRKTRVKTFFVSEGFNETWRDYVAGLIPTKRPERDLFSFYGSSEFLLMAYETPVTIAIRNKLEKNREARESVFGTSELPNIFQYFPHIRYAETNQDNELLFTAWSGIPLIRFNLHDAGRIFTHAELTEALKKRNITVPAGGSKAPFVGLYGRSDHTMVFYAANIYPEHIHEALNHMPFLKKITGKFSMEKNYTSSMDQRLIIHIELQEKERGTTSLQSAIKKRVVQKLEELNMEYKFLRTNLDKDLIPKIALHPYRDPKYFKVGLKPRYIIN